MKTVRAVATGFHQTMRYPGDQFQLAGTVPAWCVEVEAAKEAAAGQGYDGVTQDSTGTGGGAPAANASDDPEYKIKHNGGGRYIIINREGAQVGDSFPKDDEDSEKARNDAQAVADLWNGILPAKEAENTTTSDLPDA